jgi:hypothetical protein
MVKHTAFVLLSLFTLIANVYASSTATDENRTPKQRPAIRKIVIEKNGSWSEMRSSSDETPEMCASFILKESNVRRFFKVARFSSSHEQVHDLDISRCYASGRATLQDGREATWLIDRARLGVFEFTSGGALYFYCRKCSPRLYWSE